MTFTRRKFPEILDNLLTDITGGVAAESHPFPPPGAAAPPYRHSLQQPPVAAVVSVYGTRDGQAHTFEKGKDYVLLPDRQTLGWQEAQKGAQLPDPGTLLYVNYYPVAAKRIISDLQVGSVLRTLAESMALEVARAYAQLEVVYRSSFIDTAEGSSLDNVVALLDITRVRAGRPAGEVEFTRAAGTRGAITIPTGTHVMTVDGKVQYETTDSITMAPAQNTIRVVARDLRPNEVLPAGALTVLPLPIAGIAGVTNPAPTAVTTQEETDAELRARAKGFLHGSERATLGAITQALALQGLSADIVEVADQPGLVEITPHTDALSPEQQQRLLQAIYDVRPAGVQVVLKGAQPPKRVNIGLRLTTGETLLPADRRAIQNTVRDLLTAYFAKLPAKQPGSINKVVALASGVSGVEDIRLLTAEVDGTNVLDLTTGELKIAGFPTVLGNLDIADPSLPTQVDVVVTYPAEGAPADKTLIRSVLNDAFAYVTDLNAEELPTDASEAEQDHRKLPFGKFLWVIPLPGKPGKTLKEYDEALDSGSPPALPTKASIASHEVQVVVTQQSGQSRILAEDDQVYALTPYERLTLNSVEVAARSGNV
jgi:hypothetical protein